MIRDGSDITRSFYQPFSCLRELPLAKNLPQPRLCSSWYRVLGYLYTGFSLAVTHYWDISITSTFRFLDGVDILHNILASLFFFSFLSSNWRDYMATFTFSRYKKVRSLAV